MRAQFIFGLFVVLSGAGCYSTGDLGPEPYLCTACQQDSKGQPINGCMDSVSAAVDCPDNYVCDENNTLMHCKSIGMNLNSCPCIPIQGSSLTVSSSAPVIERTAVVGHEAQPADSERTVVAPVQTPPAIANEPAAALAR